MSSDTNPSQHPGWKRSNLLGTLAQRSRLVGGAAVIIAAVSIGSLTHPIGGGRPQGNDIATPGKALLGMSSPSNLWAKRVSEVGPGLQARRIFVVGFTGSLSLATTACNAGMTPVISFKTSPYSWAQVAGGQADDQLKSLAVKLVNLPCAVFVAIHHEPYGDPQGTAADFTRMQVHVLPLLGGTILDPEVRVGVIGNGWWYNTANGLTDSQLDAWVGPAVRAVSDFIAADTYQLKLGAEDVASKIKRMGAWARRVNAGSSAAPVRALGLGEWNSQTANGIRDGAAALGSDPLFAFGCVWNTDLSTVHVLTGARLTAFRAALTNW